jgi:membrane-associated protein
LNVTDQLLAAFALHGLPVLFGALVVGCAGLPLPSSLMLVAAGSFVQLGDARFWQVIMLASSGSVIGDQIGYGLGRWGGRHAERFSRRFNGQEKLKKAEAFAKRWGGPAIFFSRWLVTPLGPWLNITSGLSEYPWAKFLCWDIVGEVLWVVLYVTIGETFSSRVQELVDILGSLSWVILGLALAVLLGWQIFKHIAGGTEKGRTAQDAMKVRIGKRKG